MIHNLGSPESSSTIIRLLPSSTFFTLRDHEEGHNIDTPPWPLEDFILSKVHSDQHILKKNLYLKHDFVTHATDIPTSNVPVSIQYCIPYTTFGSKRHYV